MGTYHPIYYFLAIYVQRRPRLAMAKSRDHRWQTQQDIPILEELLPGENGLVAPVKRFQILGKGGRSFLLFRLECANHHANKCTGVHEFLVEIHLWQRRFFHSCAHGRELLRQLFYCCANLHCNRKAGKGWCKGDPQVLEREIWHLVNRHRLNFGITSIRPRDDRVKQRQVLGSACHRSNAGHDADRSRLLETRDKPGEWDALFGWLQTKHT